MLKLIRDEETKKGIFPLYSIAPLAVMIAVNMLTYYGSKLWTNKMVHYDFSTKLDDMIPFVAVFIVPYVMAYFQWYIGYVVISRESKEHCYKIIGAEIIAKLLTLVVFCIAPTMMVRANFDVRGPFTFLTHFIYSIDEPVNLFPSIHVLESVMVFLGTIRMKSVSKGYKIFNGILTLFVCLSIVFVKQHVAVDIAGGIAVALIGLGIASLISKIVAKGK